MKIVRSYIISSLVGLIIYASIVAVNDSAEGIYWIQRPLRQIIIEVVSCLVLGLLFNFVLRTIIHFSSRWNKKVNPRTIIVELVAVVAVSILIFNPGLYVIHYLFNDEVDNQDIVIGNVIVVLFIVIQYLFIRGYQVMRIFADQQTELERLSNIQLETELKFLRSQYHPHFLFNALNTVYFQMDESVSDAKHTIERLSGLLRYQLYEHQQQVKLSTEIEYLQNYIAFMKERLSEKLRLDVHFDPVPSECEVYPLLFQPLIENAFKYVGGKYSIEIRLTITENQVRFEVVNSVAAAMPAKTSGIGLENLQRRLLLLYPGASGLSVGRSGDEFIAAITLPVTAGPASKTEMAGVTDLNLHT